MKTLHQIITDGLQGEFDEQFKPLYDPGHPFDGMIVEEVEDIEYFISHSVTKTLERVRDIVEDRIRIAYRNGAVDGRQHTDSEHIEQVVVDEAVKTLTTNKEEETTKE